MNSYKSLDVHDEQGIRHVILDRPECRNAMSLEMVAELSRCFGAKRPAGLRAIVIRGRDGTFCAGGDIGDMLAAKGDPLLLEQGNRSFGAMLEQLSELDLVVVVVLEGAVMGGGLGLVSVSDVAIAHSDCRFGLPETGIGLPPAQIAPFLVNRIGLSAMRYLALTGTVFNGVTAERLGLIHALCEDGETLEAALNQCLGQIKRTAPRATVATKQLLRQVGSEPLARLLDLGAKAFGDAASGDEGKEGIRAFREKRRPVWDRQP